LISLDKSRGSDALGPVNLKDWTVAARASREEERTVVVSILAVVVEDELSGE
jgi:hypothetical protein